MNKMPNSVRKYIRTEKAKIRREALDTKEQKERINKLYEGLKRVEVKKEAQPVGK